MKKNKMMRVASALLVAVLMTTSVISGTFAKYTTTNSATDSARVAKWGVVIQADGKLYGDNYGTGVTSVPTTDTTVANLSVDADGNAVAPGTKNDTGLNFSINGTPEVRTKLSVTITCENIYLNEGTYAVMVAAPTVTATSWTADTYYTESAGVYTLSTSYSDSATYYTKESEVTIATGTIYYPVIYKADLTTGTTAADSLNLIAADYMQKLYGAAVTPSLEAGKYTYTFNNKIYDPNFDYSTLAVAGETLEWAWAFEGQNDAADTILANLQAGALTNAKVVKFGTTTWAAPTVASGTALNDYNLETSFSIDITVEQVD